MRYAKYSINKGVQKLWTKTSKLSFTSLGLGLGLLGVTVAVPVATFAIKPPKPPVVSTEVVTKDTASGENQPGWIFNRDASTSTPYEFKNGDASIGDGSLHIKPIGANPADKFVGEYFYSGNKVSSFNSFSYDFKIAGNGTSSSANQFYLNVYTNLPGHDVNNFYDCRFDYVPAAGSTSGFTTFSVNKSTLPVNVASRGGAICPSTPQGLSSLDGDSTIRAFAINVGDSSDSDTGLAGNLDNVVVKDASKETAFDFEEINQPNKNPDCANGGYLNFNAPTFANETECKQWVHAYVAGHLWGDSPNQEIEFNANNVPEQAQNQAHGKKGKVHYINNDYHEGSQVLDYIADITCVNSDRTTGTARFMFQIPEGHPGLSGLYIVIGTEKGRHGDPNLRQAVTTDLTTAKQWCQTGVGFAPTDYNMTRGWVRLSN